jgi:hypothetical protein
MQFRTNTGRNAATNLLPVGAQEVEKGLTAHRRKSFRTNHLLPVDRAGVEPATPGFSVYCQGPPNANDNNSLKQTQILGCTPGCTSSPKTPPTDPDLSVILERWQVLPSVIRAAIVGMVRAASDTPGNRPG